MLISVHRTNAFILFLNQCVTVDVHKISVVIHYMQKQQIKTENRIFLMNYTTNTEQTC